MNIKQYFTDYVIKADKSYNDIINKIEIEFLADHLTETDRTELIALADSICQPSADLPNEQKRISLLEERILVLEKMLRLVSDELYPIITENATSSTDYRHCGQRCACDVDGDGIYEHYWCKLAPQWDSKGTAYAPNDSKQTCWVACGEQTEEEVTATVQAFMDRYDYTEWVYGADGRLAVHEATEVAEED